MLQKLLNRFYSCNIQLIFVLENVVTDLPQLEFDAILIRVQGTVWIHLRVCTYIFCLNATNVQTTNF